MVYYINIKVDLILTDNSKVGAGVLAGGDCDPQSADQELEMPGIGLQVRHCAGGASIGHCGVQIAYSTALSVSIGESGIRNRLW